MIRYYRKIIRIDAVDSPNVRLGLMQSERGLPVTGETLVPGLLSYQEYQRRLNSWDEVRKCIGLRGQFYRGAEVLMFPPDWLDAAHRRALALYACQRRACAIGVDSAAGGDNTAWAVGDNLGLLDLRSAKTADTSVIVPITIQLMLEYRVKPDCVLFDYGGGGKQHADRLRSMGYAVQAVIFSETAAPEKRRVLGTLEQRKQETEVRRVYRNRRAEMYGQLRDRLNPTLGLGYGLPEALACRPRPDGGPSLRGQLAPMPLLYDEEGVLYMLPKQSKSGEEHQRRKTLTDLIGCSPDEADALVLMIHGLARRPVRATAGAVR